MAVLADGDCCYHLCGVFGDLMMDRDAVQSGTTACLPSKTAAARVRIMDNIKSTSSSLLVLMSRRLREQSWRTLASFLVPLCLE